MNTRKQSWTANFEQQPSLQFADTLGLWLKSKLTTFPLEAYKTRHMAIFQNLSAFVGFCRFLYASCMGFVGFFVLFVAQKLPSFLNAL